MTWKSIWLVAGGALYGTTSEAWRDLTHLEAIIHVAAFVVSVLVMVGLWAILRFLGRHIRWDA